MLTALQRTEGNAEVLFQNTAASRLSAAQQQAFFGRSDAAAIEGTRPRCIAGSEPDWSAVGRSPVKGSMHIMPV